MLNYSSAALLATSTYLSSVVSMLLRNVIFARILSPDSFSVALTFGLVITLIEQFGVISHELYMQRAKDGDELSFQATLQTINLVRGLILSLTLLTFAPLLNDFFRIPSDLFDYRFLAVIPLINGLRHLDPQRLHRQNDFSKSARIGITADLSSILVALLCALIWQSHWAFFVSFLFRHTMSTTLSHWWATRPFQLGFDKPLAFRLLAYSLPLMIFAAMKYLGTELDKVLIARFSGLAAFTLYFMSLMITANAANIITLGLNKIFVRRISEAKQSELSYVAASNGVIILYLSLPLLLSIIFFGESIIHLVFGSQYTPIQRLIPVVVCLVAVRQLSLWLNQLVVGRFETKLVLYAEMARIALLLALLPWIVMQEHIILFVLGFVACEWSFVLFMSIKLAKHIKGIKHLTAKLSAIVFCYLASFWALYEFTTEMTLLSKALLYVPTVSISLLLFYLKSITCREQTHNFINWVTRKGQHINRKF